jgi:hypothetical protein
MNPHDAGCNMGPHGFHQANHIVFLDRTGA